MQWSNYNLGREPYDSYICINSCMLGRTMMQYFGKISWTRKMDSCIHSKGFQMQMNLGLFLGFEYSFTHLIFPHILVSSNKSSSGWLKSLMVSNGPSLRMEMTDRCFRTMIRKYSNDDCSCSGYISHLTPHIN